MRKTIFAGILLSVLISFSACGDKDLGGQEEETVQETLVTYTDVAFARSSAEVEYARFFSTSEGKSYKDSEITAGNGAKIDLAFISSVGMCYFVSPNSNDVNPAIPGATATLYMQKVAATVFTVEQFDAMTTDELLATLTITNDDMETFGTTGYPIVLLFKNAAGKKGAIKVKSINSQRLIVDIKVQK